MNIMAIERNQRRLRQLLTYLFLYIGLADDTGHAARLLSQPNGPGTCEALARIRRALPQPGDIRRRVHRMIVELLIPMEAATRRLIIALAGTLPKLVFVPREPVDREAGQLPSEGDVRDVPETSANDASILSAHVPLFALLDPWKKFNWSPEPFPRGGLSVDPDRGHAFVPDMGLLRRIAALTFALDDLPAQAHRFARWNAERISPHTTGSQHRLRPGMRHWPLRRLVPPGWPSQNMPKKDLREEHHILAEADDLALYALRYDSS